jgi:hypothetical protein
MYIKVGNITIHKEAGNTMTFAEFKKNYTGVIRGISLEDAYKAVGGEVTKAKKPSKKSKKED